MELKCAEDSGFSLHEFEGVNEKFSSCHLHRRGEECSDFSNILPWTRVKFKLVKIFIGVSLVILEKLK